MLVHKGSIYKQAASEPHLVELKEYLNRSYFEEGAEAIMYRPDYWFEWWDDQYYYGGSRWSESVYGGYLEKHNIQSLDHLRYHFVLLSEQEQREFLTNNVDADLIDNYVMNEDGTAYHLVGERAAPSSVYLEYEEDLGETWIIHFTKIQNVHKIQHEGFRYGIPDPTAIGWTTHIPKLQKKGSGYGFGYTIDDYPKFLVHPDGANRWHAGAVLLRAEALYVSHKVDKDSQAVFWGPSAYDIVGLVPTNKNTYAVIDCGGSHLFDGATLDDAVAWAIQNISSHPTLACL